MGGAGIGVATDVSRVREMSAQHQVVLRCLFARVQHLVSIVTKSRKIRVPVWDKSGEGSWKDRSLPLDRPFRLPSSPHDRTCVPPN